MCKNLQILIGGIEVAAQLMKELPEFETPYSLQEMNERMSGHTYLNLIAYLDGKPVGFKLGYVQDACFYSWLGGVLPNYRRMGIAKKLAESQEGWVRKNGYTIVIFKTRNKHKAMLLFALNNGFNIFKIESKEDVEEYRIWMKKNI